MRLEDRVVGRRGLLGISAAVSAAILAACSDGSPRKAKTSGVSGSPYAGMSGPQRITAQQKTLEPKSYVKTYDVDAAGGSGKFKTIKDAYAEVVKDKAVALGASGMVLAQSNPWDWRLVRVAPGTYHEPASGLPPHTALVGQGNKPEDVHLLFGGADDTLATTGRSAYVRNLHLEFTGTNPDLHAFRDEGSSGDVGLKGKQIRTVTCENVRFTCKVGGGVGQSAADILTGTGITLTFVNCVFEAKGQPQAINLVTNAGGEKGAPCQFAFVGCSVIANDEQHPDPSRGQSVVASYTVGIPDFGEGRGDRVLWMDGRWTVGTVPKGGDIGALMAFPLVKDPSNPAQVTPKASTEYILVNPGDQPGAKQLVVDKTKPVMTSIPEDFDLPAGGTSKAEWAFFGTRPSKDPQDIAPSDAAQGTVKVAAGDVYWVKVNLKDSAVYASQVRLKAAQGKVAAAQVILDKSNRPETDQNGLTASAGAAGIDGVAALQGRWFYPGQGSVWVAVAFDAEAEVPAMRLSQGSAFKATGFAAGSQIPSSQSAKAVASGTLVPRPVLVSKLP